MRVLAQPGYVRADARTNAIVGALANAGIFRGGVVLVGSHAYGALLNELGVRAAGFATEHLDMARGERLRIAPGLRFEELLASSSVTLLPVPASP